MIDQLQQIKKDLIQIASKIEEAEFLSNTRNINRIYALGRIKMSIADLDIALNCLDRL